MEYREATRRSTDRMLKIINRVCYTLCIVCIVAGVICGLLIIWAEGHDRDRWKYLATVIVLFLGSLMTLSVNRLLDRGRARADG